MRCKPEIVVGPLGVWGWLTWDQFGIDLGSIWVDLGCRFGAGLGWIRGRFWCKTLDAGGDLVELGVELRKKRWRSNSWQRPTLPVRGSGPWGGCSGGAPGAHRRRRSRARPGRSAGSRSRRSAPPARPAAAAAAPAGPGAPRKCPKLLAQKMAQAVRQSSSEEPTPQRH